MGDRSGAQVVGLHRYPVKSMLGERSTSLRFDARGCVGDRLWAVRTEDGKIGSGKNTRRFADVPGLLRLRAEHRDGRVVVTFPDGQSCAVDDAEAAALLQRHLGRPVAVARETDVSHFDDGPVSLLGLASVDAVTGERQQPVEPERFRANILLGTRTPFVEDAWVGRRLRVGTAVLEVVLTSPRCVMVDAETADLPPAPGNLAAIGRVHAARLGVVARVVTPGEVAIGDAVSVLPASS